MPKEFNYKESIVINQPKDMVFNYVKHLKNQNDYAVWNQMDPDMKQTFEGEDGTVGFVSAWESDNWKVGKGNQKIIAIEEGKSITTEITIDGWGDPMIAIMSVESVNESETKVTWENDGAMMYPFNAMSLFFDVEDDLEKGLKNLKKVLEAQETIKEDKEIAKLMKNNQATYQKFKNTIDGLTEEQLKFKPSDNSWSVGQCANHIIKTEKALTEMLQNALTEAKQISRDSITISDEEIIQSITNREQKAKAPEAIQGQNKYENPQQILEDFDAQQENLQGLVDNYSCKQLRDQVLQSPTGYIDAYQFLLFIKGHTLRHIAQMKEVKENENFPK